MACFTDLGDHAENSFSVDGQPITDQQSKVFSNQIPVDSIQSLEVIEGAPPAEYGDKTSLVIDVTTRRDRALRRLTAALQRLTVPLARSTAASILPMEAKVGKLHFRQRAEHRPLSRPPEFIVLHDKGNEENFFDRAGLSTFNTRTPFT